MILKIHNIGQGIHYLVKDKKYIQLYNSYDRLVHLGEYIPYRDPPREYLCKAIGNYCVSSADFPPSCQKCLQELYKKENE